MGLIVYTAQGHADELALERPGNRLPQRSLAYSWEADQTEDRFPPDLRQGPLWGRLRLPTARSLSPLGARGCDR